MELSPVDPLLARALRASSEHAVILVNVTGTIIAWVGAAERIFGYSQAEATGLDFGILFTEEDRRLALDRQEMALADNTGRSEDDRWHVRKDGGRFWGSGLLSAIRNEDGSVQAFCKVLRDRTDLRAQIDALQNRVVALEQEQVRRTHFLACLGHELRNPFGTLQNAVEVLCKCGDVQQRTKSCAVLERQLSVMTRLLDDLFQATEVAVGKTRLQLEAVVVQDALEAAAGSIRPVVEQKDQELVVTLSPVPFLIEADPSRLHQMLLNLLGNASKFTARGGHIYLGATVETDMAVIRVRDDGIGIPPDMLPHIFDLFTREETREWTPGLGVGLAVVKELATLHGGSVEVRSPGTGKGSVFALRLPFRQAATPAPLSMGMAE